MKKLFAICLVALTALISVHLQAQEVETLVLIDTDMGKIKVKLFNDTPRHRDNFIKNVNEHLYDGLLFHRVIKQFMVQAGDINSKDELFDCQFSALVGGFSGFLALFGRIPPREDDGDGKQCRQKYD